MATKKESSEKVEREYVIPLREKCRSVPRYKKTNKAVKSVKEFLAKHMKIRDRDLNKIKLDIYLNEFLWARGIKNPPHKVKVKAVKEGDIVSVELVDYPTKLKFKKLRLEKREEKATTSKKPIVKEEGMGSDIRGQTSEIKEEKKKEEVEKKSAVVEEGEKISKEKAKEVKTPQAYTDSQHENLSRGPEESSKKILTKGKVPKVKSPEQKKDAIKEPQAK